MRYLDSIQFIPGKGMDFFAQIYREGDDGNWQMEWRFRYYVDAKAFESKDVKRAFNIDTKLKDDSAVTRLRECCFLLAQQMESELDTVELQCNMDDPKIMFELGSKEWCHMIQVPEAQNYIKKHGITDTI